MYFVPEGQHDSSQARSAWVAMQRAPSRRDGRSHCQSQRYWSSKASSCRFRNARYSCSKVCRRLISAEIRSIQSSLRDEDLCIATQALRAWLRSACPSGTKAIRPSKGLARLSFRLRAKKRIQIGVQNLPSENQSIGKSDLQRGTDFFRH
jgi:hypothetical protein